MWASFLLQQDYSMSQAYNSINGEKKMQADFKSIKCTQIRQQNIIKNGYLLESFLSTRILDAVAWRVHHPHANGLFVPISIKGPADILYVNDKTNFIQLTTFNHWGRFVTLIQISPKTEDLLKVRKSRKNCKNHQNAVNVK